MFLVLYSVYILMYVCLLDNMPQNFAKSLLDVADNLGRASSVVKVSFAKIDTSNDTTGAVPLLKSLLEGVEMTEKQLSEVKFSCCFSKSPFTSLPLETKISLLVF